MKELTDVFRRVLDAPDGWTHASVWSALRAIAAADFQIDWEAGDEEWGRVIDPSGTVVGLVCARVPIGAVREDLLNSRELVEGVTWLSFTSMDEGMYAIDRGVLEKVFGRPLSDLVDYKSLSLSDLWYATV